MAFMRQRMNEILASHTGQPLERIVVDTDRDYIMRGEDAFAYGMIDHVISHRELHAVTAITA
jgi:ATP-dependent Clp protease protease subunit